MTAALWLALIAASGASAPSAEKVRVGVLAYEDFDAEFEAWKTILGEAADRHEGALEFELAVGNYGDLTHWMRRGLIDVAVLTSGVFAEIQSGPGNEGAFDYLASVGLPPAESPWASEARRAAGFSFEYQSVCVVNANSKLNTIADVRAAAAAGRVRFLFVHPLSVSGRIAPQYALQQADIRPLPRQIEFSFSHSQSLRQAARPDGGAEVVAFVWDDALAAAPGLERELKRIPFPQLDALAIPHDVVAIRQDAPYREKLLAALADSSSKRMSFRRFDDWKARYEVLERWRRRIGAGESYAAAQDVSLDDIGRILLHSSRSGPAPCRLAIVLSGGGAKCSYQIGAVCALEEKLAELRRQIPDSNLDIDLVVGTSGGAINSVPIALGVSRTEQGRRDLQRVWTKLDQRDIVQPAPIVRWNIGLWFALAETAIVVSALRRFVKSPRRRAWLFVAAIACLALAQLALAYAPIDPWSWLGRNHLWHHAWLWATFGWKTCGWFLILLATGAALTQLVFQRRGGNLAPPRRWMALGLIAGLFGLPLIQLVSVLFFQESLSGGEGIEHALAVEFPALVERHAPKSALRSRSPGATESDAQRLKTLSESLFKRRLFQRDLVITGNCLSQTANTLPSDLYFYHSAKGHAPPPFADRGVDLGDHPRVLMDVVMGSGSIFPVFPSRTIADFPEPGESVELVDGGFAHNSPLEAAVLWGATHIVLIEATPERRPARGNFVHNAAAAFTHLHKQTQNVDRRSRQQVVVFSLQPQPPHICVLDFSSNLLKDSIERGYQDALAARFRKEFGEPVFTPL
jgi:predicted acylesterase/phospholipase RssA/ABC-type phosphate/phosphonate transport system substrate-binding protein